VTEIGFYHLQRAPLERALPKLLEKVLERGLKAVLLAGSTERVEALNAQLWTYEQRSWLPHGSARDGHAELQPVYLTTEEENPNGAQVLVLVDGVAPAFLGDFERAVDMFDGRDPAAVEAARARWKAWLDAGHPLTYWQQTESGGWEKKAEAGS
jgi:DNA polymerase-3 subunit chi